MVGVFLLIILLPFLFLNRKKNEMVVEKFVSRYWWSHLSFIADMHGFDKEIIASQIMQESAGREEVISSAGAIGLMQIKPIVLKEYNDDTDSNLQDLKNPITNITVGLWYLHKIKTVYGFDKLYDALNAYANGIGNYSKFLKGAIQKKDLPHPHYADEILIRAGYLT